MVIVEILESAGVDIHQGHGDEISVCCPFCEDRGESADTRFRLGINIRDGRAHCFNCGWKGRKIHYTARLLAKAYGLRFHSKKAVKQRQHPRVEAEPLPKAASEFPDYYESFRVEVADLVKDTALKYLTGRGVSMLQIVRHKIGYAAVGEMAWRVLFPVLDGKGGLLGMVGRDFSNYLGRPKYLNTPGVKHLWNGVAKESTAIVVEGVMDGLRTEQALLQTSGMQAVARLGSAITTFQLDQLKEFERVIVLPDSDRAGVIGASELCNRCWQRGMQVSVSIPAIMDGRDPGKMSEDEIMDSIKGAIQWSESTGRRLKLAASRELVFDED